LTNYNIWSLAINSSGHIFAGTGVGVFRATDNGDSWMPADTGLPNTRVRALAINNSSGHFFAGTRDGVFRSTNNGDSWAPANKGLPYTSILSLAINPATRNIFAGDDACIIFRSKNNGDSWMSLDNRFARTALDTSLTNQSVRIRFKRGETAATLHSHLAIGETKRYVLSALGDQTMRVLSSPSEIDLGIAGQDGRVLNSEPDGFWRGKLPATQVYFIDLTLSKSAKEGKDFELSVIVYPPGQTAKWFTYRDEKAGFELRYSDDFDPDAEPHGASTEFKTIFSLDSGSFFIGVRNEEEIDSTSSEWSESDFSCTSCDDVGGAAEQEVINSVTYTKCAYSDNEMGERSHEFEIYRTVHKNTCYEVGFVIHSVAIATYGLVERFQISIAINRHENDVFNLESLY